MNDKVGKTIFNAISENVEALSKIFPLAVKDGQVDFDALRAELGKFEEVGTGVGTEKYEFTWNGKAKAKAAANTDISGRTLRYKKGDGVDEDTTQNLYIEGDNLEALKLLRNSYFNRIKMIYIDPPYNTNNDFVYRDNFSMTAEEIRALEESVGDIDEEGNRLVKNSKDGAKYHTNWCNMIYPRLKLARDLLTDDGAIFVSIGDNEIMNLRKICDEVFNADNFVALVPRVAKRTSNKGTHFRPTKDYVLVYAKNIDWLPEFGIPKDRDESDYTMVDADGRKYKKSGASLFQPSLDSRPNQRYYIEAPDGSLIIPPGTVFPSEKTDGAKVKPLSNADKVWRWSVDSYLKQKHLLIFTQGSSRNPLLDENGKQSKWNIYPKVYFDEDIESTLLPEDIIYDFPNSQATKELIALGVPFDFAKPSALVVFLIKLFLREKDGIVLDFFSGSATTAQAVMQLNAEDGGSRKFIMVQIPQSISDKDESYKFLIDLQKPTNICEIGKERIRRAGKKIKDDSPITTTDLDIGFKVFKVADTNIRLFKSELHGEELELWASSSDAEARDFTEGYNDLDVVYELLIRHRNVPLSSKIEVVKSVGERTFIIADTIVVCLEAKLTDTQIKTLAKLDPTPKKFIFRDSAFGDDINLKLNTMTELNALIKANTGDNKSAYKVEFI